MQCCREDCLAAFHPYCAYSSSVHMAVRVDGDNPAHYEVFCKKHDPSRREETRDGHIDAERERKEKRGSLESHRMSAGSRGVGVTREKEERSGQQGWRGTPQLFFTESPGDGLQDTAEKDSQLGLLKTRKR